MTSPDRACTLFAGQCNCAQAVLATFGPAAGLAEPDCLRIAASFGAGLGRLGETCGAVSGALMVLGLRYGAETARDPNAKTAHYDRVRDFIDRFKARNQTIICRELLGCDLSTPEGRQQAQERNLHKTLCAKYVRDAAEILEACETDASTPRERPGVNSAACPVPGVSQTRALIDNLPYLVMLVLGAAICWVASAGGAWGWLAAAAYFAYGVAGAFWIMVFVCPYCHFFDTRLCPCGYGQIAAWLCAKRDGDRFRTQFRKHIPVIVPLWFIPLIPGIIALARNFSWPLLALLIAFAVDSFVILPLISRVYGCAECPQKDTCPWMGGCKRK